MFKQEPFRMSFFTALALLLAALIFYLSPAQFPVVVHKFALVTLAAVAGYWLDRHLFPYSRPDRVYYHQEREWAMIRRAMLVSALMLSVAVAL